MAQVSMQHVKELRERTQAGLNDCRSALLEAEGDIDKAVEIILKKGLAKSAKRAGAVATEGEVAAHVSADGRSGVIVEVNIQTDFAAKNHEFRKFVQEVLEAAQNANPGDDLGAHPYPGERGTIEDQRQALVGKLGENIAVRRWDRLQLEGPGRVQSYVHMGGKIGVLLVASVGSDVAATRPAFAKLAEDVAMQVAAMAPLYLDESQVPQADKAKQAEIFDAQLAAEGKPENVRRKIIEGKMSKWMREVCLLQQQSVLETDKSVDQMRAGVEKELATTVRLERFVRYERGEGLDKARAPDFASEVARMAAQDNTRS